MDNSHSDVKSSDTSLNNIPLPSDIITVSSIEVYDNRNGGKGKELSSKQEEEFAYIQTIAHRLVTVAYKWLLAATPITAAIAMNDVPQETGLRPAPSIYTKGSLPMLDASQTQTDS